MYVCMHEGIYARALLLHVCMHADSRVPAHIPILPMHAYVQRLAHASLLACVFMNVCMHVCICKCT